MINFTPISPSDFQQVCNKVALHDKDLKGIIDQYAYPPFWSRPNTFESLLHIILEQQVSLASALAALNKLKEKISAITPANVLSLTDEELRTCYFSRQKSIYTRHLAESIVTGKLSLTELETSGEEDIRRRLISVKGIGNWTVDIYLIFILHHPDIFPLGDLAAINALKKIKRLDPGIEKTAISGITERWRPFRTIATMLLWHFYLQEKKKGKQH